MALFHPAFSVEDFRKALEIKVLTSKIINLNPFEALVNHRETTEHRVGVGVLMRAGTAWIMLDETININRAIERASTSAAYITPLIYTGPISIENRSASAIATFSIVEYGFRY